MSEYQVAGIDCVIRARDHVCIPECVGNSDWDEFMVWRDNGGVPDPIQPGFEFMLGPVKKAWM